MFSHETLKEISAYWGIECPQIAEGLDIAGSPERSIFRTVIEASSGKSYLLESIAGGAVRHRLRVAGALDVLRGRGLSSALRYLPDRSGCHIAEHAGRSWQLSPFVAGVPLPRPDYVFDQWRGKAMARFISDLTEKSAGISFPGRSKPFSITAYGDTLLQTLRNKRPVLFTALGPIGEFLAADFRGQHDRMPLSLCHGDYHPLNIIWGRAGIRSVIDWEFAGFKPELYDVANLVGCIGIEAPEALTGDLVRQFIGQLKREKVFSDASWTALHGFILALRFAWLSEWLRKSDEEMIALELAYMNLLIEHRKTLEAAWTF